jgi:alanine racemase
MLYPATTWVEVSIEAIRSNVQAVKAYVQQHSPKLIAVIKADAYGHGAIPVARALQADVSMFAVATVEEAIRLRESGIDTPTLVLFNPLPDSAEAIVHYQLTPAVCERMFCKALSEIGKKFNRRVKVHVNVDTGMHRSGLQYREAVRFVQWLTSLEGIEIEGLFTHFATADEVDGSYAGLQLKRFKSVCAELARLNLQPSIVHAANSAGTIAIPESYFDAVRIGLILYGIFHRRTSNLFSLKRSI